MSISKRYDGEVAFECDECGDEYESNHTDFKYAIALIKQARWLLKPCPTKLGKTRWEHYCPTCRSSHEEPVRCY